MSNGEFDDVGVLTTLQRLKRNGLLNSADLAVLEQQLKTDWGRRAFQAWQTDDPADFRAALAVLKRFSNAFS
jgi:hypothetical protein